MERRVAQSILGANVCTFVQQDLHSLWGPCKRSAHAPKQLICGPCLQVSRATVVLHAASLLVLAAPVFLLIGPSDQPEDEGSVTVVGFDVQVEASVPGARACPLLVGTAPRLLAS